MSRSQMMNFRLREEDIPKLDAAARALGMDRSTFIRSAVTELVARTINERQPMQNAGGRGPSKPKTTSPMPYPDCPRNAACSLTKLPTGIKVCSTCGCKIA